MVGLDNCWDLWTNHKGMAVISIRRTNSSAEIWMANFYAAMIPAMGSLQLSDSFNFKYDMAPNPRAVVLIGWLTHVAFLSRDILPIIDSLYKTGTKEFIITGHSQGGAVCFLLTSWLLNQQKGNRLEADVRFETYCMAAPKTGNLYDG